MTGYVYRGTQPDTAHGRPRLDEEHGTVRGYLQHSRRKTKRCRACRGAWAAYYRNYHQARKAQQ